MEQPLPFLMKSA